MIPARLHSLLVAAGLSLLGPALCLAAAVQAPERGRARAVMVPKGPKVEGSLSDPLWKQAPPLRLVPAPGMEGKLATSVRLLFDETNLYVAIECEEPDPQLQAKARERDAPVWQEDCVELYILPHPEAGYKHISINPLGTVFDQAYPPGRKADRGWNADVKVAVSAQPGQGWKVALSIPFKDLGARAGKDQTWRFNATRVRKARAGAPQQEYTWADLPTAEFHQPDAFGVLEPIDIPEPQGGAAPRAAPFRSGLRWTRLQAARGVQRVFPHPLDPAVAWCAAAEGLLASNDDGRTWKPVESAAADALGEVTCLAVSTREPEVLCLGTEERGLFLSGDGGKSWKPLGGDADRYASNHVEWVDFCPSDPTRRTLTATHGVAAPGISISRDLGATWEVFGKDRYLKRFVKQGETIVAVGSPVVTGGKLWGIHRSGTDGFRWEETVHDVQPAAVAAWPGWQFFACTLSGRILHSFNDGKSWTELARCEGSAWTSLFFTNGPTDQTPTLAAYDPHRQGLCLSRHRFAEGLGERQNEGLYVGPYVKSGATAAANANGTTYYVAMNNILWIGRWTLPTQGPAVAEVRARPCSVRVDHGGMLLAESALHADIASIASGEPVAPHVRAIAAAARAIEGAKDEMKFTVEARVEHPRGPGGIKSVTVDLSKLGGSRAAPLYDDGKHDDQEAGDGIYATAVTFSPAVLAQPNFRETLLVTVTAADESGASDSWPAVVHVARGPMPAGLMRQGWDSALAEGPVTVKQVGNEGVYPKTNALSFAASGPGPWRAAWIMPGEGANSAGCKWLTFHIRGDANQELFVHLMDHHRVGEEGFLDEPHFSKPAPLIAGGYLKAITPTWQKVRIPIAELLPKGVYFLRWHTAGVGLSLPEGGKPGTYYLDLVQVEP